MRAQRLLAAEAPPDSGNVGGKPLRVATVAYAARRGRAAADGTWSLCRRAVHAVGRREVGVVRVVGASAGERGRLLWPRMPVVAMSCARASPPALVDETPVRGHGGVVVVAAATRAAFQAAGPRGQVVARPSIVRALTRRKPTASCVAVVRASSSSVPRAACVRHEPQEQVLARGAAVGRLRGGGTSSGSVRNGRSGRRLLCGSPDPPPLDSSSTITRFRVTTKNWMATGVATVDSVTTLGPRGRRLATAQANAESAWPSWHEGELGPMARLPQAMRRPSTKVMGQMPMIVMVITPMTPSVSTLPVLCPM